MSILIIIPYENNETIEGTMSMYLVNQSMSFMLLPAITYIFSTSRFSQFLLVDLLINWGLHTCISLYTSHTL